MCSFGTTASSMLHGYADSPSSAVKVQQQELSHAQLSYPE